VGGLSVNGIQLFILIIGVLAVTHIPLRRR